MTKTVLFFMNRFFVFMLVALLGLSAAQAEPRSAKSELAESTYQSLESNPRAVVKTGFFVGISKDRVSLLEGAKSRNQTYRLEPDYKVIFNNQVTDLKELGLSRIPPHSVVKLIMLDGQVREIILVEVSS